MIKYIKRKIRSYAFDIASEVLLSALIIAKEEYLKTQDVSDSKDCKHNFKVLPEEEIKKFNYSKNRSTTLKGFSPIQCEHCWFITHMSNSFDDICIVLERLRRYCEHCSD